MNRGGRPSHKYWKEGKYTRQYEGKKLFAYCTICKKTIRHTAESRLRDHRKSCQEPLIDDDEELKEVINVNRDENDTNTSVHSDPDSVMLNVTNEENTDVSTTSSSNAIQIQPAKRSILRSIDNNGQNKKASSSKRRKRIDAFIDKMSYAEKAAIDSSLIKFLCGCNIPFNVLDSTHFKEFVKLLRPAYEHPSRSTINTLLNSVYHQLMTDPSTCEQSEGILMISSNMMSQRVELKHIVGIVHRKSRGNLFIKIWSIPVNANDVTEIVHDAVQISKEKYKVDIYAVIADGDLCMSTNRELNNLWFFKCQATVTMKIVNLFETIPFTSKVRSVLNGFQTPRLKEEIANRGGVEFEVVDNGASIFAIKDMFINCLKNILIFKQILTEHVFRIPDDVISIFFDTDTVLPSSNATFFEEELKKFISLCEHFCSLISKCQRPCSMCDIIEQWLQIESIVAGDKDNSMTEIHSEICAILSPISLVANCLHPVYRGLKFEHDPERNVEILEYLLTVLDDRGLDDFYDYSKRRGLFEKIEIHKIEDPEKYWDFAGRKHPSLANFAKKLTQIPASVAQVKFQTVCCDNICPDNDKKIVQLYYRLKLQDENITDKY